MGGPQNAGVGTAQVRPMRVRWGGQRDETGYLLDAYRAGRARTVRGQPDTYLRTLLKQPSPPPLSHDLRDPATEGVEKVGGRKGPQPPGVESVNRTSTPPNGEGTPRDAVRRRTTDCGTFTSNTAVATPTGYLFRGRLSTRKGKLSRRSGRTRSRARASPTPFRVRPTARTRRFEEEGRIYISRPRPEPPR